MYKYRVEITEKQSGYVDIEAESREQAKERALESCNEGKVCWTGFSIESIKANEQFIKLYYTFGSDKNYPYQGGWVEVHASSVNAAHDLFRRAYPDREGDEGILNCCDYYTEKAFKSFGNENLGAGCHDVLVEEGLKISFQTLRDNWKEWDSAVIVFTEGMTEKQYGKYFEFMIPKIAIGTLTVLNATEKQRLETNFQKIIYPIFEELQKRLRRLHLGYDFALTRTDIPYFPEAKKNTLNDLIDGCIIKNLKMKVSTEQCTSKVNLKKI